MQNLVLVGGGHSHAIALLQLGQHPIPGVRLTLITDAVETPYSGMLPGYVAGIYQRQECHINLRPLAARAGAKLVVDRAVGLDLDQQQVQCAQGGPVDFDWLSLDIGSTPLLPLRDLTGIIPAKPVPQFLQGWDQFLDQVATQPEQPLCLGIVGGGAGGIELALSALQRLHGHLQVLGRSTTPVMLHLFQRGASLLPDGPVGMSDRLCRLLTERGVCIHFNAEVVAVQPPQVICQSGLTVTCSPVIWVTQASAPTWIAQSGLAVDGAGFVQVDAGLRSLSHPQVFATGDIATQVRHPRPKAGVFAVRQGRPLAANLRRAVLGQPLKPYCPPRNYLRLIGTGDGAAIAIWGSLGGRSPLMAWIKTGIDRRFMAQFRRRTD
jgi:selenide, water dikinase